MTRLALSGLIDSASASARVIRGTAAFTAGSILQRAVSVLLLPVFTRILSPGEFGQIGVLTTVAAAMSVVVSFGLETAIFRGYRRVGRDKLSVRRFLNTVGAFALLVPAAIAVAFSITLAPVLAVTLGVHADALRLASAGAAFTASATLVPLTVLRAQERLVQYLQLTAVQLFVTILLTLLLVAQLDQGVTGWMLAYALSGLALLLCGFATLNHEWRLEFEPAELRSALTFGVPLIPHALSHWGLSVSDRAILAANVPAADVGAYYVAYLICLPISLMAIASSQASQPVFADAGLGTGRDHTIRRLVTLQAVLIILVAAAVGLVGPSVSLLSLPPSYALAATIIPWLALGTGLFGLYLMPMNAITLTAGRTRRVWLITVLAAAVNIGLNLVLVPSFGTLAAAVNTTIGYGVLLIGVYVYQRRVCQPSIGYDVRRIALGALVIGLPSSAAALLTEPASGTGLAVRVAAIVLAGGLLVVGPFRPEALAAVRAIRPRGAGGLA